MSLPINGNNPSESVQIQSNPSLEPVQNVEPAQIVAESTPQSHKSTDLINKQEAQPVFQAPIPNGSNSHSNEEKAPESQLDNNQNSETVPVSNTENKEIDSEPKKRGRKPGSKNRNAITSDFEHFNDLGNYIPETSRSGRQIKKTSVFQVSTEPTQKRPKRSQATSTSTKGKKGRPSKLPAAVKVPETKSKRGRKPKNSNQNPVAPEADSKPQVTEDSEVLQNIVQKTEQESVPSATIDNVTIPANSDIQTIPQVDSNLNPQPISNDNLNTQQNVIASTSTIVQPQTASDQQQAAQPLAQLTAQPIAQPPAQPLSDTNIIPQANGIEQIVQFVPTATITPTTINDPVVSNDQQIANSSISKPEEISSQLPNPSVQNPTTFPASALAPETATANTTTSN